MEYVQIPVDPNPEIRLTLEDIPVGPTYQVWLSVVEEQPEGWFKTYTWVESQPFNLAPGQEAVVAFSEAELFMNPIFDPYWDMMGISLKGILVDQFDQIITADQDTLYTGYPTLPGSSPLSAEDLPAGYLVNSIDWGVNVQNPSVDESWLNTNRGILPVEDLTITAQSLDFSSALGAISVLGSAGRDESGANAVVWYFRDGGLGGAFVDSDIAPNPSSWSWVNTDSDLVFDCLTAYPGDGYFATSGGLFRLPWAFLQDASPSIDEHKKLLSVPGRVLSLGLIDQSGDGDTLFLGTDNGVWYAGIDSGGFTESLNYEPITAGHSIRMIAIGQFISVFKAYLSDTHIFIWNGAQSTWSKLPLCAGVPSRITGMAWCEYGAATVDYYLLVAGSEGLTYLWVD
jgi:hypothetical protein